LFQDTTYLVWLSQTFLKGHLNDDDGVVGGSASEWMNTALIIGRRENEKKKKKKNIAQSWSHCRSERKNKKMDNHYRSSDAWKLFNQWEKKRREITRVLA
jgi:hypothetical protein